MRHKIEVANLKIGMYVAELDRPWVGSPFLFQGFEIESDEDLAKLREACKFVYVDDLQSSVTVTGAVSEPARTAAPASSVTITSRGGDAAAARPPVFGGHSELKVITKTLAVAHMTIVHTMDELRMGKSIDSQESKAVVQQLVKHVSTNPNSMLWLTSLQQKHEHTARHCLNVSILAIAFGRHLNLSDEDLNLLGLGAVLHDVGKMRIPKEILDKPGKLTEEEYARIRNHANDGHTVLKLARNIPEPALAIVRSHHERVDGKGYPDGLQGDAVPRLARVVALADAYDMLTGDYPFRTAIPPADALRILRTEGADEFGADLVQEFIKCLGIYPVGSLVQVGSGALGIVMASNPSARLKPLLMMVRDENGQTLKPRTLMNLALLPDDKASNEKWNIQSVVDPKKYNIDVAAIVAEEVQMS
ncbi:MAG TPA: HD-GYP domain-containing protein [Gammaproteobacteria bacterium]|nr:HD-GYP domain-containing protein [Gammaproteobacteria bacterium]